MEEQNIDKEWILIFVVGMGITAFLIEVINIITIFGGWK